MSTQFDAASSESAFRTGVTVSSAMTFGGYGYLASLPSAGNYAPIITLYNGPSFNGLSLAVDSAGKTRIIAYNADAISGAGTATLSTSTWYYFWLRIPTTGFGDAFVYINGSTTADLSRTIALSTPARLEFATSQGGHTGGTITSDWWGNWSLSAWKGWAIDRAASNAAAESASINLVSSTSAIGNWHFLGTDIQDKHSTANHLTATGTLSAGPDSPVDGGGAPTTSLIYRPHPMRALILR